MRCLGKRVIVGLVSATLAVMVFAPSALGWALPVLVAVVCPIGMIVMMRGARAGPCHRLAQGTDGRTGESAEGHG